MPWPTIVATILADEVMIVTGLVGALTSSTYKWGYWTFAMLAFFYVIYSLVITGRSYANALAPEVGKVYLLCGVLTVGVWFLYPIAWGVSEGGNVIHPDGEAIFYGILDVIAKPVFGTLLILGHRNVTSQMVGITVMDFQDPIVREKAGIMGSNGSNGAYNGHTANTTATTV